MNILLVVRWPVGGIRTYLKYMLRDSAMQGKSFTMLAPKISGTEQLKKDLADYPVDFIETTEDAKSFIKSLYQLLSTKKFDLIHAHGMTAGAISAVAGLRQIKTPIILSAHDVFHRRDFIGLKGFMFRTIVWLIMFRIKAFNTLGKEAEANLFEYYPNYPKSKVVTIRNGIDTHNFHNAIPIDLRSQLSLTQDHFLIGFLGRFMGQKGFKYLLSAIDNISKRSDLTKKPIIIAIDAAGGFEREERQKIKDMGLEGYFRFIPFTDNVGGLLKGLDLVAMPSVWECCPLLPMEALCAGTPFAGSNCIGLNEIIQGTPAKIFESESSDALEQALLDMMNMTHAQDDFTAYSKVAINEFSSRNSAKSLSELYDKTGG